MSKLILVLGATGAQGRAVVNSLLAPSEDGAPSPYAGVEVFRGDTSDLASVAAALDGAYGAWINIDGFTVGEQRLDYNLKKGGYDQKYRCEHYDAKGRVAEWLAQQLSVVSDTDLSWSVSILGPVQREDGTFVFNAPIGDGHIPMVALADIGFFARHAFDHRAETSGKNLEIASEWVGWEHLVATFTKVTGHKAVYNRETVEEWLSHMEGAEKPVAAEGAPSSTSWAENFTGWWNAFKDDVNKRDIDWIRKINPNGYTLEKWMIENNYDGTLYKDPVLKIVADGKSLRKRRA
ncbi:NAD-P-binding protein [Lactarius hengduanensis]|nr:NAD-P-binding protein [Lactarius hengduanensis]